MPFKEFNFLRLKKLINLLFILHQISKLILLYVRNVKSTININNNQNEIGKRKETVYLVYLFIYKY